MEINKLATNLEVLGGVAERDLKFFFQIDTSKLSLEDIRSIYGLLYMVMIRRIQIASREEVPNAN